MEAVVVADVVADEVGVVDVGSGVVVSVLVTLVVAVLVAVDVKLVVTDVVGVVVSHRLNPTWHSCVPAMNGRHAPLESWHCPDEPAIQPWHKLTASVWEHRRLPGGQVCVVSFAKGTQKEIASKMQGPKEFWRHPS